MSTLAPAVSGKEVRLTGHFGDLVAQVAGEGAPLLLVHSINAAASAAEVAPVHEWARARYRTYSVDLPGFGLATRAMQRYTPRVYTDAVLALAAHARAETGQAPMALGLSTSAEFVARAATEAPDRLAAVALVTPTGFDRRSARRSGAPGQTREIALLSRVLGRARIGRGAFRLLTRPGVIRYFLERTFGRREIDETLWRYCCESVRLPGAEHAPLAFISGRLFSADIRDVYERLRCPVWLAHGTRGDFNDFTGAGWVASHARWSVQAFPTGAMPWFEAPAAFLEAFGAFLEAARAEAGRLAASR